MKSRASKCPALKLWRKPTTEFIPLSSLSGFRFRHGSGDYRRIDADAAALLVALELDDAVNQRKEGVVFAQPDIVTGMELRAALAYQHVSGAHRFATELFDAAPL